MVTLSSSAATKGGDVDTQVRMIVAALSYNAEMAAKVLTAIIEKYDLVDDLKEIVNHESI
ncbi:hypothetical protein [Limosilactobacillus antri]|uniref:hypothetical protein n=1 Tax=Limosilactobacillus antri TaxID=227943 RepID=UPI001F585220|nr:hypothetical protein [Limosilactobacillus antri]